jgi:nicotinamidase-related amidase
MTTTLICIDFINEIVDSAGKLASKGYYAFTQKHGTLVNLAKRQAEIRSSGGRVIHVHLGFATDYVDHPSGSPLLGGARAGGILKLGTPSTAIHHAVAPHDQDIVIVKKRISAFYGTSLEIALRSIGPTELIIAGVATDLAVQSAARDAHDRDFVVRIAADCCAAASDQDHATALLNLAKFAKVI